MKKILSILLLLAIVPAAACYGQKKIYTKKAKLANFTSSITKVIASGEVLLDNALQTEVSGRWTATPYEFSTIQDFEAEIARPDLYFLRFTVDRGVVFLSLQKGGAEGDRNNPTELRVDVVSIPVCAEGAISERTFTYLPALVEIIQRFTLGAMESDKTGYMGLLSLNRPKLKGRHIAFEPDEADALFLAGEPDALCGYLVHPTEPRDGDYCYRMLITADTHELVFFKFNKLRKSRPAGWLDSDLALAGKKQD